MPKKRKPYNKGTQAMTQEERKQFWNDNLKERVGDRGPNKQKQNNET